MDFDLNRERLELEINKLKLETIRLKRKWYQIPKNIISIFIILVGIFSVTFLTRITDIKSERLLLEKETLKHEIITFKHEKDSIKDSIYSLKYLVVRYSDSLADLNHRNEILNDLLLSKEGKIKDIILELSSLDTLGKVKTIINKLSEGLENAMLEDLQNRYSIFPNPANEYFYVVPAISSSNKEIHIILTDLEGKQLISKKFIKEDKIKINLNEIPSGLFLLKIQEVGTENYNIYKVVIN